MTRIPEKEWTLMFFFACDNPLAPGTVSQLKSIKDAGFHPDANVIAQFDPHTPNTPVHIFDVNLINKLKADGRSQVGFDPKNPFVRSLVLDKLWAEDDIRDRISNSLNEIAGSGGRDNGHRKIEYDPPKPTAEMSDDQSPKDALYSFLSFCREFYPARHYMLFILGHGVAVGNDIFLFDEHAPEHSLSLTDLGIVLRKFKFDIALDERQGELELLGFHSCSMSGLEVASELEGTAKYMLASQGPAFVGSWPYRQILLRVFNDLNSTLIAEDLIDVSALATRLKDETDPINHFLRSCLADNTRELLHEHDCSQTPDKRLVKKLLTDLNKLLSDPSLFQSGQFWQADLSETTSQLVRQHLQEADLRRLNRNILSDACKQQIANIPQIAVKEMLIKIFYYCLYNSHDFQLAGYSFDLTLCDLKKVSDLKDPLTQLSEALIRGLEYEEDPLAKEIILLAHWDAQSYWEENYTDLYDFCFCLKTRCHNAEPSDAMSKILEDIWKAGETIMGLLKRGVDCPEGEESTDDGIIVRSEFAGPLYQYSHGLSIFFPWSEPVGSPMWDKQYETYRLSKHTKWRDFLKMYFDKTMRAPQEAEARRDRNERQSQRRRRLEPDLLELLQTISTRIFNSSGQLNKGGVGDTSGILTKGGGGDPTGDNGCVCPSIKNYPFITRARQEDKDERSKLPISRNFFAEFDMNGGSR